MISRNRSVLHRLRVWISGPQEMISLFQDGGEETKSGVLTELWDVLRHPVCFFREEWQAPRTRASLFHYIEEPGKGTSLEWKGLLKDLLTAYRFALFIPSLWCDQAQLAEERAALRTRRMEAGVASLVMHAIIMGFAFFFALYNAPLPLPQSNQPVVFVGAPMHLPLPDDGKDGGGGGGGGRHEKLPAASGRLPDAARTQLMPPEPGMPQPLTPSDNSMDVKPSVQMPIDLPIDSSLPIGDITAPFAGPPSSGPGDGGGIGKGNGPGIGSGNGPGAGTGDNGGFGGGRDGGVGDGDGVHVIGNGLTEPEAIANPLPPYTEEARKAHTEGLVSLQVTIRKDGTVGGFKVIRGLGHGLDESAIDTIATKWRFKPGTFRGVPVDVRAVIEVLFRLF